MPETRSSFRDLCLLSAATLAFALPSACAFAQTPEDGKPMPAQGRLAASVPVKAKLQATVNKGRNAPRPIEVLYMDDVLYVNFKDFLLLFDFPISLSRTQSQAAGFFGGPSGKFVLDIDKNELQVGSAARTLEAKDFHKADGTLYVSEKALQSWFGANCATDRNELSIHFSTPYPLPAEAREERERKRREVFSTTPTALVQSASPRQSFKGRTGVGYEVELYRNGQLTAFQFADNAGQYAFHDVPLVEGTNDFLLLFFGPQGQYAEKKVKHEGTAPVPAAPVPVEVKKSKPLPPPKTEIPTETTLQKLPLQAGDWATYSVVRGDAMLGQQEVYAGIHGTFLRLDSFLRFIDVSYAQQKRPDFFEMATKDGRRITLDLAKNVWQEAGAEHKLFENAVFINDDKIYANTDLLHRLFPSLPFTVDQALLKLVLLETTNRQEEQKPAGDLAPAPDAAPVIPVIIDDGGRPAPSPKPVLSDAPEAQDVLHLESAAGSKEESKETQDSETLQPLILQPAIKNMAPRQEFIEAMESSGKIFLPLNDLLQIVGFPIKMDDKQNTAEGFFFTTDNKFYLDVDKKEVRAGEKVFSLMPHDIRKYEGALYVNSESFAEWFGIICDIDRSRATLHLKTDKLFPEEERDARQKQWNRLLSAVAPKDDDLPVLQNPYRFLGYPTIDVNLGSLYTHSAEASNAASDTVTGNYNLHGAMELAYMTGQFYVQGSANEGEMPSMRLQLGRKDPESALLGALRATEYAMGDITSPSISFVTTTSPGRGALITNRDFTTAENFDVRSFTGDSVPGYEVELYRNNILLAFQTVDESGRYNFQDIPILYGNNIFRIVSYGPQGQIDERTETVSTSSSLLKQNRFEYTIGANQRGVNLIKSGEQTGSLREGTQLVGSFRYGVTPNYTLGAAFAETKLDDGPHRYLTTSSGANIFGILSETSFAKDMTSGGWASGMSVLSGFKDISLRARYRKYKDFVSESVNSRNLPLKSEAQIDANSQFYLPLVQGFGFGLSALREEFEETSRNPRYTYGVQFSKSVWGFNFSNRLDYVFDENKRFQDTFGIQTRLWGISFRASGIYDFAPVHQFKSASFMADYRLANKLSAQSQIEKNMTSDETSFGQSMNWDFDAFRLSFSNRVGSNGDFTVGMNVLFSLNHNELTGDWKMQPQQASTGGAVAGRVFSDDNNNGVYDEGEKIFPEAAVRVNRASVKLDENGFFVSPVAPYETSRLMLSMNDAADPLLTPKLRGYRVQPRPGDTVIADFPLVQTTVIDGTSYFLDHNGERREVGSIVVELQDKEQKPLRRIVSEIDGYYSFDKVEKGEYWIGVPEEVLSSLNARLKNKIHVLIEEISEFITDQDLVLEQLLDLTKPPDLPTESPPEEPLDADPFPTIVKIEDVNASLSREETPSVEPVRETAEEGEDTTALSGND